MDYEIAEQIKEFVEKHCMCKRDKVVMAKLVVEEANELLEAAQNRGDFPFKDSGEDSEKEEVADVIISALVYAELSGFFDEVDDLIKEKMIENLEKPARERIGVKVSKNA